MAQTINRTGEMHVNRNGQHLVVVEYKNNKQVWVWCKETQQVRRCVYLNLRRGRVYFSPLYEGERVTSDACRALYCVDVDAVCRDYERAAGESSEANIAQAYIDAQAAERAERWGLTGQTDAEVLEETAVQAVGCALLIVLFAAVALLVCGLSRLIAE